MSTQASEGLPKDSPIMKAWNDYKESEEHANAFKWAEFMEHRDGSLWNAFLAGYRAAEKQ